MAINELKRMSESGELPAPSMPISDNLRTPSIAEREDMAQSLWMERPLRRGARVTLRRYIPPTYVILKIEGDKALCRRQDGDETVEFDISELVRI